MATVVTQKSSGFVKNEINEDPAEVDEIVGQETPTDSNVSVKIEVPGTKSFELQVSTGELVNDLRGYITDREDCCHRTCFSLQFNGIPMDHFAELRSIDGLQDGSVFKGNPSMHFTLHSNWSYIKWSRSPTQPERLDYTFVMFEI